MTRTTATLSRLLISDNEVFRCLAAQALGRLQAVQSIDALLARLFDEDEDVCHDVAEALGHLGDARAVAPLCELYAMAPFGDLKVAAVRALGRIGGEDAVALLRKIAGQRDETWNAVEPEDWDSYWDAQALAIAALGSLGDVAGIPIVSAVLDQDGGQELAPVALKALLGMGEAGRAALLERLRAGRPAQRRQAARLLGRQGEQELAGALRAALDDEDGTVRAEALAGLAGLAAQLPADTVSRLVRDGDPAVRAEAAVFLAALPLPKVVTHWKLLLRDERPAVRANALRALGQVNIPAEEAPSNGESSESLVEGWLAAGLDDPRQEVGRAAVLGLAERGTPSTRERLLSAAGDTGREAALRVAAVAVLGRAGSAKAGEDLTRLLEDPEATVRLAALRVLAERSNGSAASLLAGLVRGGAEPPNKEPSGSTALDERPLDEPAPAKPLRAGEVKGSDNASGEPEAPGEPGTPADETPAPPRSTLEAMARSREDRPAPRTLEQDLAGAGFSGEEAQYLELARDNLKAAHELLHPRKLDPDLQLRVEAARLLRRHPADDTDEVLTAALGSGEAALQEAAAETAGALRVQSSVPALAALVSAETRQVRLAVVRALGEIGTADAVRALLEMTPDKDPLVRREQVAALQAVRDGQAEPLLQTALDDQEPEVVRAAVLALAARGDPAALPAMMAALARNPERNWRGLGTVLAAHMPEAGRGALLDALENPQSPALVPAAITILEEMEGLPEEEQA